MQNLVPHLNGVASLVAHDHILIPRIRVPYPFQWGAPTFDAGEAFAMMAASFVALVEVDHYLLTIL